MTTSGTTSSRSLREVLLQAALTLFSSNGYNAVSMRAIAKAAGANVGSLTYHFGSKANLLREIYRRHTGPMNQRRLELLGEARRIEDPEQRLVAILRAYVIPAFSLSENDLGGGAEFTRLRAILSAEGNQDASEIIAEAFDDTSRAFHDAIADCVPGADEESLLWRGHFLLGALYYALINPGRITRLSGGAIDGNCREAAIEQLVQSSAASFRALSDTHPTDRAATPTTTTT